MSTPLVADEPGLQSGACELSLIVAMGRNRVIGRDNALPWRLPEDTAYFKKMTMGHVLIMGRKTFDSVGRPLPGRRTIVITRNPAWQAAGTETASSLAAACTLAGAGHEVFVAGGTELFREALGRADRLLVTEIDRDYEGDTFFPAIPPAFHETDRTWHTAANDPTLRFAFVTYLRNSTSGASALAQPEGE